MQKAMKWLDAKKIQYTFQNYKEVGIDKNTLGLWLRHFPADKLINTKSTTYRALHDDAKMAINNKQKAIEIMMQNPSIIKRPVWDLGGGKFYLGWSEDELNKLIFGC